MRTTIGHLLHRLRAEFQLLHVQGKSERYPSFPFISGDTYRAMCDVVIENSGDLKDFCAAPVSDSLVFVSSDLAFNLLEAVDDLRAARTELIVHNGDLIPEDGLLMHASRFRRVHAVNWLGNRSIVNPLPIGLENAWLKANGRLSRFYDCIPSRRAELLAQVRDIDVLVTFNDNTCTTVRTAARSAFLHATPLIVDAPPRLTPTKYHRALRRSRFVPSPRGNGVDCHRTWEAIYTGAVPIVLDRHWAFAHIDLPVLVVSNWESAVNRIKAGPEALYRSIIEKAPSQIYAWDFMATASIRAPQ